MRPQNKCKHIKGRYINEEHEDEAHSDLKRSECNDLIREDEILRRTCDDTLISIAQQGGE